MFSFPQISSGTIAQLPIRKIQRRRTITNVMPGGARIKAADPDAYEVEWELRYSGLTDAERATIETFFQDAGGRLRSFLFLDPTTNLLRWSGDLVNDVWSRDGLLNVTASDDVYRMVNAAQSPQGIAQHVECPENFHYVFSAYARADAPLGVLMRIGAISTEAAVSTEWRRVLCSGSPQSAVVCRVDIPAGAVVEMRGLQLEAQPMPSEYRRTAQRCGVYPVTRFAADNLVFTANGIDDHAVVIRLSSRVGA
jgi:hypothetical protein